MRSFSCTVLEIQLMMMRSLVIIIKHSLFVYSNSPPTFLDTSGCSTESCSLVCDPPVFPVKILLSLRLNLALRFWNQTWKKSKLCDKINQKLWKIFREKFNFHFTELYLYSYSSFNPFTERLFDQQLLGRGGAKRTLPAKLLIAKYDHVLYIISQNPKDETPSL